MAQVRRNDPCPCGSGKKYKSCCLRKDRLAASRDVNLRAEDVLLLRDMSEYVSQPRFRQDVEDAMAIFWGGRYAPAAYSAVGREGMRRFIEWFLHDYRYGEDRRYIIDLFIEREGHRYPAEAREVMEAWSNSVMGMFRYVRRSGDDQLQVYDPLRENELEIHSSLLAHNAQPGDVLVGRLYRLGDESRLSTMTLILPSDYELPLADYVRNAYTVYCDEHPDADWERFLRTNGHLFNAFLLSSRAEGLRSLIGAGTRFYDPAATRDKLREITREQRRQESDDEVVTMDRMEPMREMRHSPGGIILPGAEEPEEEQEEQGPPPKRPTILIPGRDT